MDRAASPRIETRDLEAERAVEVTLSGDLGPQDDPAPLEKRLGEAIDHARASGCTTLRLRLEAVAHYRARLVALVAAAARRARDRSLAVTITYDAASIWQPHAFGALKSLAPEDDWLDVRAGP
jgi:hypothetical protein